MFFKFFQCHDSLQKDVGFFGIGCPDRLGTIYPLVMLVHNQYEFPIVKLIIYINNILRAIIAFAKVVLQL